MIAVVTSKHGLLTTVPKINGHGLLTISAGRYSN